LGLILLFIFFYKDSIPGVLKFPDSLVVKLINCWVLVVVGI
uniref:Cytochrome b n=1 Tax=Brugia timori TaxID=42155 RepID=A0A0R3QGA0_9BILA